MDVSSETPLLPPLSELLAWTTDHLIDGSAYLEATADRWETIFTSMWQDVHTIDWEGQAADAARTRLTSDRTQVSGGSDKLRAGAKIARAGAPDVLSAQNRLRYAIEDAAGAGFVVYDDCTVEDTQVGGGADRQAQAAQFATEIYSRAKNLVGVDSHVSQRLNETVGDIGNYFNFDESDGTGAGDAADEHNNGVQLVDHRVPLAPGNQAGNDATDADGGAGAEPPPAPGLPPPGLRPPVEGELMQGPASKARPRRFGGQSLYDENGGEWRYDPGDRPGDRWHNPHWDYNPHLPNDRGWRNIQIGDLPPRKVVPDPLPRLAGGDGGAGGGGAVPPPGGNAAPIIGPAPALPPVLDHPPVAVPPPVATEPPAGPPIPLHFPSVSPPTPEQMKQAGEVGSAGLGAGAIWVLILTLLSPT
jgi:hypothetical protein